MPPLLSNIGEFWRSAGLIQRVVLLGILLACIGAGVLLVGWARRPEMGLLYSHLEPDEAARIVEKIREAKVVYELKDNGTSIHVPQGEVYSLRLTMAGAGLPTGGQAGYKVLDENRIGASPFIQRVNYIRAIEGELAKTIRLIEGVNAARVHVVRPEATLFTGQQKKATATVALRLRAGWRLSRTNVAAIVHMIAGAVEGLTTTDVVVVDEQGRLYTGAEENELTKGAANILDYKSQVEQYLSEKAERMLTAVLGPNRASVRVSVTLETMSVTRTSEKFDPEGKVVKRETLKTKALPALSSGGKTATPGKESTTETDYEISKTIEQSTDMPGKVKSKMVAAFVDLTPPPKKEGDDTAPTAKLAIKDVEEIIRSALGLTDTDKLKVVDAPFHQANVAAVADTGDEGGGMQFWLDMARQSSLGVLVIGVLLALRIFHGSKKNSASPAVEGQVASANNLLPGSGGAAEVNTELLRSQITSALQENPEEVKRLFLSWVQNEEGE